MNYSILFGKTPEKDIIVINEDELFNITKFVKSRKYVLSLDINPNDNLKDISTITKLFNYIDALKAINEKNSFLWQNFCVLINVYNEADAWRLESMLLAQAIINKDLYKIFIQRNHLSEEVSEESLLPINNVAKKSFRKIMPIFSFCGDERKSFYTEHIYFQSIVDPDEALNKKDFQDIIKKAKIKTQSHRALILHKKYETQLELFKDIIFFNLANTLGKIQGSQKYAQKYNKEEKRDFIDDFNECVCDKFAGLNLLSQYIWTNMLNFLVENKEIITLREDIKTLELSLSVIEKSFCDAIAYSEGIYQLLENSVLHTRFQISNLAIRNFEVRKDNINESKLIKNLSTRMQLLNIFGEKSFKINDNVKYCMEILYCDCAISKSNGECLGITDTYNRDNAKQNKPLNSIDELFTKKLDGLDIARHYGLQLFERNIILNQGIFHLTTPLKTEKCFTTEEYTSHYNEANVFCNRKCKAIKDKRSVSTCYTILLPITYEWSELRSKSKTIHNNGWLYENKLLDDHYNVNIIEHGINSIRNSKEIDKLSEIEKEYNRLVNRFKTASRADRKNLININASDLDFRKIEILAKTLFEYIYKGFTERQAEYVFIALYFDYDYQINEFIRIFSVFYDRKGYNNYFDNLQLGLFLNPEKGHSNRSPELGIIIAGGNINEIYQSAVTYAYSNNSISVRFVNQCRYFVRTIESQNDARSKKTIPLFPFDLILKNKENKPYFLNNLENEIKSHDIREHDYGCVIEDIHIRLGSKIHLKDFYEAELVFHNGNNINKLAYLIAMDIAHKNKNELKTHAHPIMIVGYESYSALLIQEIVRLLRASITDISDDANLQNQVNYCIFSTNENIYNSINYSPDVTESKMVEHLITESVYFTVLPIGTTLTTIYKIQNVIKRNAAMKYKKSNLSFNMHYVLIVISQSGEKTINNKYWLMPTDGLIELRNEINHGSGKTFVKPYINIETEWQNPPKTVEEVKTFAWKDKALIYVDKTSTIPNAIFKLNKTETITSKSKEYINNGYTGFEVLNKRAFVETNEKKLEKMQGCITYGHLKKRDNHYLYYIDAEKYFSKVKEELIAWLKINAVKDDGYNIIISPLHNPDSSFLKAVMDYGFLHNFRLIHISIYDSKRDEVLSKFSYIMKQYDEIRKNYANQKINFYFVDHSIVTGNTVSRSLSLIRSLMRQSGFENDIPMFFKGIFTLVNRSTKDTISSYVKNVNSDYKSFVYLFAPNFNTHNNECPTCDLVNKYKLLEKHSSTNLLSNEYARLSQKHSLKDLNEYNDWLKNNILYHRGYYNKLKQWLYRVVFYFSSEKQSKKFCAVDIDMRDEKIINNLYENIVSKEKEVLERHINSDNPTSRELSIYFENKMAPVKTTEMPVELTMADFDASLQKDAVEIFTKYVQGEKNFIRLQCTHRIFKLFESNEVPRETKDSVAFFEKEILNLILKEFSNGNVWALGMEYFISYIKIISRPFISEYYNIKSAILNIINNLLSRALSENKVSCKNREIDDNYEKLKKYAFSVNTRHDKMFSHVLVYQLMLCLSRRITDLHSQYFLDYDNINRVLKQWNTIKQSFCLDIEKNYNTPDFDYFIMNTLVSDLRIEFDIIKLAKWSSMSTEEDAGSFIINDIIERGGEVE